MAKKNTKQFIQELKSKNRYVEIIGEYLNAKTKIKCKCLICKVEFEATPDKLLQGTKHKECATKISTINRTKSHEQFIYDFSKKGNKNIDIIGKYTGAKNKIKCKCTICNEEFYKSGDKLLQGEGHDKCSFKIMADNMRRTTDQFIDELKLKNNSVEIIGDYVDCNNKILCRCKICNKEFWGYPENLLKGAIHQKCASIIKGEKLRKSHEQFISDLNKINKNIIVLGTYINNSSPIECKCKKCNTIWKPSPASILNSYTGCPTCNQSKGERKIQEYLKLNSINFIRQMKFDNLLGVGGKQLSYDFILNNYNLLIEYQGQYHKGTGWHQTDSEYIIQQEHDRRKKQYTIEKNIELLEIWYWDFKNINKILDKYLSDATASFVIFEEGKGKGKTDEHTFVLN